MSVPADSFDIAADVQDGMGRKWKTRLREAHLRLENVPLGRPEGLRYSHTIPAHRWPPETGC